MVKAQGGAGEFGRGVRNAVGTAVLTGMMAGSGVAQQPAAAPAASGPQVYKAVPGFDPSSIDTKADPCADFYKFACGKFAANHPIPPDQPEESGLYSLTNVNTQELRGILEKAETGGAGRSPNEQKIGDYYSSCMDAAAIERKGLAPLQALLAQIEGLGNGMLAKRDLLPVIGRLQREGVDLFFGYGEQQDLTDATKQIATAAQGGLGLPEKDYYLRTGAKDEEIRKQYVAHVAKMLTLAGSTPEKAQRDAEGILRFETMLAKASLGVVDLRDPEKTYHLQPIATFEKTMPYVNFNLFEDAVHSPHVTEINDSTPEYFPALMLAVRDTDMPTLKAYMRYHLLTHAASRLPKAFDDENFDFYSRKLEGQPEDAPRWKRCSNAVNGALGEALGEVYVQQFFAGDSKERVIEMVRDIEHAMDADIDGLDWMSAATKAKAKEKLHAVSNKIGYPDRWRDYSALEVKPDDALSNMLRADAFESDRELAKIGKPVDHGEWSMSPPTVNAYYDPSLNDINFPAGILQRPVFDKNQDAAVNYGHAGSIIGHELTHGFDDQGKKFDGKGNLSDWWTPEDTRRFEAKTDCLANEYSGFTAVDDVKVNGKLTLGENTADNGGLLLAYMAYLERAKRDGTNLTARTDGYTPPQRFYIAYGQNWCQNARPESVRALALQDPHAPDPIRADGAVVNQPGFAEAFGCKRGAPMAPANSCRVW